MPTQYRHKPTGQVVDADNHDHAVELIELALTVATDESRSNGGGRAEVDPADVVAERDALFSCEGFEGVFKGRTSGQLWNGWECPRFTHEEAVNVLNASQCAWEFKDGAFRYLFLDDDGVAVCSADPDGLFPIGSQSWCWELDEAPANPVPNDRLIAAAPKLLAALKRLVGMANLGEVDLEPEEQAALENARAVIREIEGT